MDAASLLSSTMTARNNAFSIISSSSNRAAGDPLMTHILHGSPQTRHLLLSLSLPPSPWPPIVVCCKQRSLAAAGRSPVPLRRGAYNAWDFAARPSDDGVNPFTSFPDLRRHRDDIQRRRVVRVWRTNCALDQSTFVGAWGQLSHVSKQGDPGSRWRDRYLMLSGTKVSPWFRWQDLAVQTVTRHA